MECLHAALLHPEDQVPPCDTAPAVGLKGGLQMESAKEYPPSLQFLAPQSPWSSASVFILFPFSNFFPFAISMLCNYLIHESRRCFPPMQKKQRWMSTTNDWEKKNNFSSWLLPIHTGNTSFMSSATNSKTSLVSSGVYASTIGFGRCFSFTQLQEAMRNFNDKVVIDVGGFDNVYLGELDDSTKVAMKRGNPHSDQGINEFHTEVQMLSKLRHRHLVSLIGYCDENSEMIHVYEYMANGPFCDHIYGKGLPPLSWKKRLEICISVARGRRYLHTQGRP